MSLDLKDCTEIALSGASIGILTSSLSAVSGELFNTPLGYAPFNIKNFLKVSVLGGCTFVVIIGGFDFCVKPVKEVVREKFFPNDRDKYMYDLGPAHEGS